MSFATLVAFPRDARASKEPYHSASAPQYHLRHMFVGYSAIRGIILAQPLRRSGGQTLGQKLRI